MIDQSEKFHRNRNDRNMLKVGLKNGILREKGIQMFEQ